VKSRRACPRAALAVNKKPRRVKSELNHERSVSFLYLSIGKGVQRILHAKDADCAFTIMTDNSTRSEDRE
jgi:hypothetical protein